MKQEDKYYEEWLTEIRNRQPVMSNPDELTANILQQVSRIPYQKRRKKLLIGSWLSGIAASLLLCLLVSETLFNPVPYNIRSGEDYRLQESTIYSLPEGWEGMNLSQKGDYLSEQYIQFKKLRKEKIMEFTKKIK